MRMPFPIPRPPAALSILAALALAAGQASAAAIPVLFLGGGATSHDPSAMRAVIEPVLEKNNMVVDYRTSESILNADSLARYHVLFIYNAKKGTGVPLADGSPNLTTAQENALYKWVEDGNAVVAVHSASSSYLANPRWAQLIGASYTEHGEDLAKINIVKPNHPAMQGVSAPTGADEGRMHAFLKTDTIVLATSNSKGNPWTWIRPQGKGWVYYTSSGHDNKVWSDTKFQNQLVKAVTWGDSITHSTVSVSYFRTSGSRALIRTDGSGFRIDTPDAYRLQIVDVAGTTVFLRQGAGPGMQELPALPSGAYRIGITTSRERSFTGFLVR